MNIIFTTESPYSKDTVQFHRHECTAARGADEQQIALLDYLRYFVDFNTTASAVNLNTVDFVRFAGYNYFVEHAAPLDVALATDGYSAPHPACCAYSYHTVACKVHCEHNNRC
jgi:hypothetical protein